MLFMYDNNIFDLFNNLIKYFKSDTNFPNNRFAYVNFFKYQHEKNQEQFIDSFCDELHNNANMYSNNLINIFLDFSEPFCINLN